MAIREFILLGAFVWIGASAAWSQDEPIKRAIDAEAQTDLMVTVYNNNYGLVREIRNLTLPEGTIELEFRDVAALIDPTSVAFKSLTSPSGVGILEQNYRYDLLNPSTLLDKFIGRAITFTTRTMRENSEVETSRTGILLSTNEGRIVQFGEEIVINPAGAISLNEMPEELLARPTLLWLLHNETEGEHEIETSYLTNGMNWKADYVAVINASDTALDLTGWVTLDNRSGATYRNVKLKLVAGDVQRVVQPRRRRDVAFLAEAAAPEAQFAEKSFFEYHLYTLGRRTTLANNETKQMTLLEGSGVRVKKDYILESPAWAPQATMRGVQRSKLSVVLAFENSEENNLGMALPKGRVRVYKADTDSSLQLVGEDLIDHTPRDETIRLKLGEAFDVVAERSQTSYRKLGERSSEQSFQVTVRNHKEQSIRATIIEHIYGDWTIVRESDTHYKRDSRTIEYSVAVDAGGEAVVTYTVRVNW